MKRRYQIEQQCAMQKLRQLTTEEKVHIQMIMPMADIVSLPQEGVRHLRREAELAYELVV